MSFVVSEWHYFGCGLVDCFPRTLSPVLTDWNLWDSGTLSCLGPESALCLFSFCHCPWHHKPASSSPPAFLYNKCVWVSVARNVPEWERLWGSQTKAGFHSPGTLTPWILAGNWRWSPGLRAEPYISPSPSSCCLPHGNKGPILPHEFLMLYNMIFYTHTNEWACAHVYTPRDSDKYHPQCPQTDTLALTEKDGVC